MGFDCDSVTVIGISFPLGERTLSAPKCLIQTNIWGSERLQKANDKFADADYDF